MRYCWESREPRLHISRSWLGHAHKSVIPAKHLRAALEFARDCGDTIAALQIAAPLGRYAYLRGHYHEVREWMDTAVAAAPGAPAALRAKALLGSGRRQSAHHCGARIGHTGYDAVGQRARGHP